MTRCYHPVASGPQGAATIKERGRMGCLQQRATVNQTTVEQADRTRMMKVMKELVGPDINIRSKYKLLGSVISRAHNNEY